MVQFLSNPEDPSQPEEEPTLERATAIAKQASAAAKSLRLWLNALIWTMVVTTILAVVGAGILLHRQQVKTENQHAQVIKQLRQEFQQLTSQAKAAAQQRRDFQERVADLQQQLRVVPVLRSDIDHLQGQITRLRNDTYATNSTALSVLVQLDSNLKQTDSRVTAVSQRIDSASTKFNTLLAANQTSTGQQLRPLGERVAKLETKKPSTWDILWKTAVTVGVPIGISTGLGK
ncbi:MAG: hypothetical protein HY092_00525 [Candidatus Kerfeldbacteria bacterium]|nr:hypothetical protein [Candidatus Kerfeldbacteria bacterium]